MICSMKELLFEAEAQNRAVGAFSVYSMETVKGVIAAAEQMDTPVILQIAESRFPYAPLELMAPMMVEAARKAQVKVAVHLDHGLHMETIRQALDYGFTSVMLDASKYPLPENIHMTQEVIRLAASYHAAVEAEIGCIGGNEGMGDVEISYTRPEEAERFVQETKVDALAVAIGNAHGNYREDPHLHFQILEEIHRRVQTPLVLHGGSGISFADFRKTMLRGMRKINIATANLNTLVSTSRETLSKNNHISYFDLSRQMTQQVCTCTKTHIYVFNGQGSLDHIKEEALC